MTTAKKKKVSAPVKRTSRKTFKLPAEVRIHGIEQLKENLLRLFDGYKTITLDGSSVNKIDFVGVQLLTAFCLSARSENIDVKWKAASEPLIYASRLLDLSEHLNLGNNA